MKALGTIVEAGSGGLSEHEMWSGLLDYYDHWDSIDNRLATYQDNLSKWSEAFGHDIVNIATYSDLILTWLEPKNIRKAESVVAVGGATEAFLVSLRSACDTVGGALSCVAAHKLGQAPTDSFRALVKWAENNPTRVRHQIKPVLSCDLEWFWNLRSLRDFIIHKGATPTIHTDGRQFNLWVYAPDGGWVTREPLLPLLKNRFESLLALANNAAESINTTITMPADRIRSRVVCGVLVPRLHKLLKIADQYNKPSP